MKITLSEDQRAIGELFSEFFAKACEPSVVRHAEPLGFDAELWSKVGSLDAFGMGVALDRGGSGASLSDLVVVAECVGRSAAPIPLVEHLVALRALQAPPPDLMNGDKIATLGLQLVEQDVPALIPAGAIAHAIVALQGDRTIVVRSDPPGAAPSNHASMPLAFRGVADGEVVDIGDGTVWATALSEWQLLTAATLVGIAAKSLEIGTAYVSSRKQFGQPVGGFQAVQHGLADLPGLIDGARLLVFKAAWAMSNPDGRPGSLAEVDDNMVSDSVSLALMAFLFAAEVAAQTTDRVLHYHGGYGFAEEYDIGLFYRRARGWALVQGDPALQYQHLADRLFGASRSPTA